MKTSLLRTLVCIALFAFAIAVAAWQIERVQIGRDWNNVGGGYTKNLLPLTGWEFVWIGGAAGDRVPTSLQELNSRLQAITSLPRCKTLRIYSEVLTEINTAKPDSESLQALLRGVKIDRLELIEWSCTTERYGGTIEATGCRTILLTISSEEKVLLDEWLGERQIDCNVEVHIPLQSVPPTNGAGVCEMSGATPWV
jgi:hypothetical protein